MMRLLILGLCVVVAGCDDEPSSGGSPPPDVIQIVGNERIGWNQPAASAAELDGLRYLAYVDGAAGVELRDVSCGGTPDVEGFACSARLPAMQVGPHSLALSSFIEDGARLESERSSPLNVVLVGQATMIRAVRQPEPMSVETVDGLRLSVTVVASGLEEPMDLAFAGDGRIFVGERAGRVRVVREGGPPPSQAVVLQDVVTTDRNGLLALALDPEFERTGLAYSAYTADSGFRLARFRARGDVWSERTVLLDAIGPPARRPAAMLRVGPDGKLYLGIDDGDVADRAGDLGSFSGKVLRLNADGTTPVDQLGGTPVFALPVNGPRGEGWDSSGGLWIVQTGLLQVVVADVRVERRGRVVARYSLPEDIGASGLTVYRANLIPPFQDNVLIAGGDSGVILRLQLDRKEPTKVMSAERLLLDAFGPVRTVGVGRDGAVYFCTPTSLMKMVPDRVDR